MDYLFIFLLSTGFVGGVFAGLKKSAKAFVVLFLTFAFFSIIFKPVVDFVLSHEFLKIEFSNLILNRLSPLSFFSTKYQNGEELIKSLSDIPLPEFIKTMLLKICKGKTEPFVLGGLLADWLYKTIALIVVAIVLLVCLYTLLTLVANIVFLRFTNGHNMFVTKRVMAGIVGGLKGITIFVGVEVALVFICQLLCFDFIDLQNSPITSLSYKFLFNKIDGFITHIF